MSNIGFLKRDAVARRACGWHYGADTLPLREVENVCPFHDPQCVDMCMRPQVCGSEPE